jgi:hypothetical protein
MSELMSDYVDNRTYLWGGVMDSLGFTKRELKIIADRLLPGQLDAYPWNEHLRLVYDKVMSFIDKMDAEQEKPDYNCMRGISVPVDMDRI